ncbi:MAG: insulinase family protein [Magnetococcales bacterium]|nr:insulinase family protein [Magnetococcales bacterium]
MSKDRGRGWLRGGQAALLFSLVLWSVNAQALVSRSFTLENGLQTVLVREPKAPVVVTQVWYRVGAADEEAGKTGLAHMLEHMMFQGTEKIAPAQFSKIIARNGGEDNASTAQDYTNYWIKLSSDRLDLALSLEADRMRHLRLQEAEFDSENLVVREERRSRTDSNPTARFLEKFRQAAYGDHPYGRPVIGWMEDVKNHTIDDLRQWYRRHYSPDQAILVVVGDIDFDGAEQKVRKLFSPLENSASWQRPPLPKRVQPDQTVRLDLHDENSQLSHFFAGFSTPSFTMGDVKEAFALELLSTVLGSSASSRIYRQLVVKEGLAVSARSGYGGLSRGEELFSLSATPRPGVSLEQLEEALFVEVEKLVAEPIGERELQRAKNGLIAGHLFAQDSVDRIAWLIGRVSVNEGDWRLLVEEYPDRVQAVTAEEIQQVAQRYLKKSRATIGTLQP